MTPGSPFGKDRALCGVAATTSAATDNVAALANTARRATRGEPERGHLQAVVASIEQLLSEDDSLAIRKIAQANAEVRHAPIAANRLDLPAAEWKPIGRIVLLCDALAGMLNDAS